MLPKVLLLASFSNLMIGKSKVRTKIVGITVEMMTILL